MIKKVFAVSVIIVLAMICFQAYENNQNWKILRRSADGNCAREIMLAILSYQNDNLDKYPLSLDGLVKSGRLDEKYLISKQGRVKGTEMPHFIYIYSGDKALKSNDPVVYLRESCNHKQDGKTIVGFADGHYEYTELSKFGLTSL